MTQKSNISSAQVLDLFLWRQIQVQALMTGGFSVSLSLLQVGILGCVEKGAAPLVGEFVGGVGWVF
jgi:hypothetical protein